MRQLLVALSKIIEATLPRVQELKHSGNIKNKIQDFSVDKLIMVSDSFVAKQERRQDAFAIGADFGRVAKQKPGYLIELPVGWVAFIGTEADIVKRLDEYEAVK
jgi:hypothetical protein